MASVEVLPRSDLQRGTTFKEALALRLSELYDKISLEYDRAVNGLNPPEREQRVASDTGGSEHLGPASSSSAAAMDTYLSGNSPTDRLFHQLRKKAGSEWAGKESPVSMINCVDEELEETKSDSSLPWPKAPPSLDANTPAPPHSQPPNVEIMSANSDSPKPKIRSSKKVCWHEDTFDDSSEAEGRAWQTPTPMPVRSGSMKSEEGGQEAFGQRTSDEPGEKWGKKLSLDSAGSAASQVLRIPDLGVNNGRGGSVLSLSVPTGHQRHPNFRPSGASGISEEASSEFYSPRGSMMSNASSRSRDEPRPTETRTSKRGCLKYNDNVEVMRASTNSRCSTKSANHHFEVLRHWRTDDEAFRRRRTPPIKMGTGALIGYGDDDKENEHDILENIMFEDIRLFQRCLLHPSSRKSFALEILALMFVSYDIVTIPLEFFDPPQTQAIIVMSWLVRIFWTFELVTNFFTGYVNRAGDVEMRLGHIARRYMRTWFILDFVIVLFNWMEVSVDHIGTAPRSLRFLKIARLLRLVKASALSRVMSEKFRSEKMRLAFGILKILVLVLIVAHFIACLWYGVGNHGDDNWVAHYHFEDAPLKMKYLSSFHWSLTQFTGPDMDLQPVNETERSFTLIVLVSCYVVSACFVSSITTSMTRLELLAEHQTHLFVALRRYLDENRISMKLSSRIQRNATHAMFERSRNVQENEVELLNLVSEPLRIELHFEIYDPVVRVHPLFARYMEVSPAGIRKLCHTAVSVMSLSCGDVLFNDFEFPEDPRMYFLLPHGRLQYIRDGLKTQYLLEREWCCEAALWTMWMHVGMMRAMTNVRLVTIDRELVATAMSQFRTRDFRPELYAKGFVASLNRGTAHLTDLRDPEMDWDVLLEQAFPKEDDASRRTTAASKGSSTSGPRKSLVAGFTIQGHSPMQFIAPKTA